jgi:polyisoprenoid-binding protein YceI
MRRLGILAGGLLAIVVIGAVALIVIQKLRSDDPNLKTEAPAIPQADTGATAAPTRASSTPSATTAPGLVHFVVDQSGSEVKYVVREKLARLPASSDAVGTTNAITGDLFLSTQGLATTVMSTITVDLTKLKTDEALRDNFVRQSVLQTGRFPMATFTAEAISGFPANYVDGSEASLTISGTLTIHGVSKPVQWAVKARHSGAILTGIADLDFNMTDFGITPPNVQVAKAENGVHLQITLLMKQAT